MSNSDVDCMAHCGLQGSLCGERVKSEMLNPPCRASQATYQMCTNSRDEELSKVLLKSEGVSALVSRSSTLCQGTAVPYTFRRALSGISSSGPNDKNTTLGLCLGGTCFTREAFCSSAETHGCEWITRFFWWSRKDRYFWR